MFINMEKMPEASIFQWSKLKRRKISRQHFGGAHENWAVIGSAYKLSCQILHRGI